MSLLLRFAALPLLLSLPAFGAEEYDGMKPRFAFSLPEGIALAGSFDPEVRLRGNDGSLKVVWTAPSGLVETAFAGGRLVAYGENTLHTVTPGAKWSAVTTTTEFPVYALAGSPDGALAFTADRKVWRLQRDGTWTGTESGIKDEVLGLAFARGQWVAVGAGTWKGESMDEEGNPMPPPFGWSPGARTWWSRDGKTWTAGTVPVSSEGEFPLLDAVAASADGWLATGETGGILFSKDGKTWQAAKFPPEFSSSSSPTLGTAGGKFWLREENQDQRSRVFRSGDGQTWTPVPLGEEAQCDVLFDHAGAVQGVGRLAQYQPLLVGPLARFADDWKPELPAPTIAGAQLPAGAELRALPIAAGGNLQDSAGLKLRALRSRNGRFDVAGGFGGASGARDGLLRIGSKFEAADSLDLLSGDGWEALVTPNALKVFFPAENVSAQNVPPSAPRKFTAAAANATQLVAVGNDGLVTRWEKITPNDIRHWLGNSERGDLVAVATDGKIFVGVGRRPALAGQPASGGGVILEDKNDTNLIARAGPIARPLRAITHTGKEWIAVGDRGIVLTSPDAKQWTHWLIASEPTLVRVAAVAGRAFAAAADGTLLARRTDGGWDVLARAPQGTWAGLAADGDRALAFTADGKLLRLPATPAPLAGTAALAMSDATAEAARQAQAAQVAAAQKAEQAKADAAQKAAAEKAQAAAQRDAWPEQFAAWDAAIGAAPNTATRFKLTRELLRDWVALNPDLTREQRLAFITPFFHRLLHYERSDESLYGFVDLAEELQSGLGVAFTKTQSAEIQKAIQSMAADRVAAAAAQQQNRTPPPLKKWVTLAQNAPRPTTHPEDLDLAALRKRAARGDGAAAYDLGLCHQHGYGTPLDDGAMAFWFKRAESAGFDVSVSKENTPAGHTAVWKRLADQGSVIARLMYGLRLRDGIGVAVDHAAANANLRQAADAGHRDAAVHLALQLRAGRGGPVDLDGSRKLLESLDGSNHGRVLSELGWIHEAGAGVPRDFAKAAEYFRRAAEKNYPWAMRRYGDCLLAGRGVAKNEAAARSWFEKATALGDAAAKTAVTELAAGKYRPAEAATYVAPKEQRPLFDLAARRKQAEAGDAAACYDLAYAYWHGHGVREDDAEGNRWNDRAKQAGWKVSEKWTTFGEINESWRLYGEQGSVVGLGSYALSPLPEAQALVAIRRAAEAGYAPAQTKLGIRYRDGVGVTADVAQSTEWIRRAATLGEPEAQTILGYSHETGRGVEKDAAAALRWYRLAAEGGHRVGTANLAGQLAAGTAAAADLRTAAGWYLELAGLPNEPTEPAAAAARIRAKAEAGDPSAYGAWGVMLRRGFGTAADPEEAFAYGFTAANFNQAVYAQNWFEPATLRRAPALRRAAKVALAALGFTLRKNSANAEYAAKVASGAIPTAERIFAGARPENSTTVRTLRALHDGTLTVELATAAADSFEPFALPGLDELAEAAGARADLAAQPWLLRLAGVTEKAADAAAAEKLFQTALLAPAADGAARDRLQTLRRLAAARLYYGIGRTADRPAALAWTMLSVDTTDSLLAVDLLARELSAAELDSADELFGRIATRIAATKP